MLLVGVKFGINIAPDHLHSESLKQISRTAHFLPAHHFQIVLEITDAICQSKKPLTFAWLHSVGVEIAIDDWHRAQRAIYQTPSSFTLDYPKIDRGFINAIGTETITLPVLDA